jgi:histone-binding protein RBBP4
MLPEIKRTQDSPMIKQKIIYGTHIDDEQNYLIISSILLPNHEFKGFQPETFRIIDKDKSFLRSKQKAIEIELKIVHSGHVNKARASYQSFNLIATKSSDQNLYVFDYTKHSFSSSRETFNPQFVLKGHEAEGWGIDWSLTGHQIVSSDNNGRLCVYDLESETNGQETTQIEGKKQLTMEPIFSQDF